MVVNTGRSARYATAITVSDRVACGERDDASGPLAAEILEGSGWTVELAIVADEEDAIAAAIRQAIAAGSCLIVTTGGTGLGPRDVTPEATASLLRYELPGIAEQIRQVGVATVPRAMLSRGLAGVCGPALVVNLAGSTGAVRDGVPVILEVADHAVAQLAGGDHP